MILITGASSGLGAAVAKQYAEQGHALLLTGRSQERLQKTLASCRLAAPEFADNNTCIQSLSCELSQDESVEQLIEKIHEMEADGQMLAKVIHCAGSGYFGELEKQQPQAIRELIDNNVTSSIMLLQQLVMHFKHKPIKLVVVMSTAALSGKAGETTYCAAKWAVRGFVESLRLELKGLPMKLIAVYPGGMDTGFWPTSGKHVDTSSFMSADEAATMLIQALPATEHGYVADLTIQRG
ncbi:SDR family NAD(P)-dependent oxidoreductase [Shewanella maritima]|uniref:SDR family NAD(P)-dependent oxidoreductase n=1 Tax=Shewanella maritima TaxID=2520507 RepID=A0A411PH37_9GAMM|nr:SDR family NAD(P)-dependent oxidoreductase [Shewanella maritima]QBF82692.1 SDR family NAD(P)-dependent oxidoreductase [Shewanella maritima]